MSLENIAEICIAIDTAILGIAYPIIIDKISNIGDKYSSDYLSNVFNTEFPQNEINLGSKKVSTFQFMLYLNILILVFWFSEWNHCSAGIIGLLIILRIYWCYYRLLV